MENFSDKIKDFESVPIEVHEQKEEQKEQEKKELWQPHLDFTQKDIIEALNVCLVEVSPLIKPTTTLKNMVYHILKSFFIDKKRYVIANCPTGSGKTIIGFMTYFCVQYLVQKSEGDKPAGRPKFPKEYLAYFLTSNKVLQEQIDNDIRRFDFFDYLFMLKGVANYKCIEADNEFRTNQAFKNKVLAQNPDATFASYEFRPCLNMSSEKIAEKFTCFDDCPYKNARAEASQKSCTILNYAYFLNVLRTVDDGNPNRFFNRRLLTIADEAHLIPDIVCNFFNFEFNQTLTHRIKKLVEEIIQGFGTKPILEGFDEKITKCLRFFYQPVNRVSEILKYLEDLMEVEKIFSKITKVYMGESFTRLYGDRIAKINEQLDSFISGYNDLKKLSTERPEDVYFESEKVSEFKEVNTQLFKHYLKDLKEAEMVRNNFLDRCYYGLFMSATLGDMDEYAALMGMKEDEYTTLYLPSTFDFSKSPIYITNSGYLNYNSFDRNIDKVLNDCIRICMNHPNEKGVIHTGTFRIGNMLKDKLLNIGNGIDFGRFLFYNTTKEKEELIEIFRNSTIPYIFVGPSLYEGIDLPDDKCRFQILIKVPYAQMSAYIRKKIERYPFWYKRNCIEKIIQAIGRSNRHKNDYSTIYLLDSCFDKIIYETNEDICNRLEYKKIY